MLIATTTLASAGTAVIVVGVNVVNPERLNTAERAALLDQLQLAGVHVIRTPLALAWAANDYGAAIDFVLSAYARGIKADLIVDLQYRAGARRRPAVDALPKMWPSYPLSSADPKRFRAVFKPLFDRLEGAGVVLAALEFGNEINWTAFNGDFPIPGEGRVFDIEDLAGDPEARQIAKGYDAYLETLKILKDIRDHSRLNKETPILSAGLADPGPAGSRPGPKLDAVTISATLGYLRIQGMDALVDAYAVHTYPAVDRSRAANYDHLREDTFRECRSPATGKPCWLTEWGLPSASTQCPTRDAPRAALAHEMLAEFGAFIARRRLQGLFYYAWSDDRYGIDRCGSLTPTGHLVLDASHLLAAVRH